MDLGNWLRNQGLERFEATFRDNCIDETVLPHLTQEHLRELGLPLGARIKLLAAIAALPKEEARPAPAITSAERVADVAERRQVTVLFSDLVGSTALSTRMDPEDLRKLISAYQRCVTDTVRRFGGFVAKYMGDGVLIYFGYPEAHEDDAERAVRSGLELVDAVARLKMDTPLQTRVGIAIGLVVVGDLVGSGQAQERGIVGETPNLAARLQGLAEPDTVVIADATRRLLGIAGPRPAGTQGDHETGKRLGRTSARNRRRSLRSVSSRRSRCVCREGGRIAAIAATLVDSKEGEGQVVLISGEAGIGKSRLTGSLLQQIDREPHARIRCFGSAQRTDSALHRKSA